MNFRVDTTYSRDVIRTTVALLFIAVLIGASVWVLRPFVPALIWATVIAIATWPIMLVIQARLWGKRGLAVLVMTGVLLLLFVVPLWLSIGTIVANSDKIVGWSESLANFTVPPPPHWVDNLPLVGAKAALKWQQLADAGREELKLHLSPYLVKLVRWAVAQIGSLGVIFIHFLLTVIIAAVLYSRGEIAARGIRRFAHRVAGPRGEDAVFLAAQSIRAVALGLIVTALVQAALAWVGLTVAGAPYAALSTALVFMLGVAQLAPVVVLVPTVIWAYWKIGAGWGTTMLIWTILVGGIDNFLRPVLIKRGADLPLLLVFSGVIGGLIAFGIVGLFIGPVVLAVTYTLLASWVGEDAPEPAAQILPQDCEESGVPKFG